MLESSPKPEIPGLLNGIFELSALVNCQDSAEAHNKIAAASEKLLGQFRIIQATGSIERASELDNIDAKIKTMQKTIRILQADIQRAMEKFQKDFERASQVLEDLQSVMKAMARNIKG